MSSAWSDIWAALTTPGLQVEASPVSGGYLVFGLVAVLFVLGGLATSALLRRRSGVSGGSTIAYEGGEEPYGSPWVPFHARFYTLALVFLLFEIEIAFMFPYALAFARVNAVQAFVEGALFVAVLGLGLLYAWVAGLLDWPTGKRATATPPMPERYRHVYKAPVSDFKADKQAHTR